MYTRNQEDVGEGKFKDINDIVNDKSTVNAMKCSKVWISPMMREDDGVCEFDVEVEKNEVAKETK